MLQRADATTPAAAPTSEIVRKKTVCTHCSVGCSVIAEVENGVWVGQEPAFDSPFNLGGHCAKGAAIRELGHGERRTKYPMRGWSPANGSASGIWCAARHDRARGWRHPWHNAPPRLNGLSKAGSWPL